MFQIPALYTGWTFFTFICCIKVVKSVFNDKIKRKRGQGWPI